MTTEGRWQRTEQLNKWKLGRAYSCPTSDLLNELKLSDDENDTSDEDQDEVFECKNKAKSKDRIMADSGFPLTYLGSLEVTLKYRDKLPYQI